MLFLNQVLILLDGNGPVTRLLVVHSAVVLHSRGACRYVHSCSYSHIAWKSRDGLVYGGPTGKVGVVRDEDHRWDC